MAVVRLALAICLSIFSLCLAGCFGPNPNPNQPTVVPNVVKMTWDKAYPKLQAAQLSSQLSSSLGWITTPDHILVTATSPKAGTTVPSWSTVFVTVTLTQVVTGISELDIVNQNQDQRQVTAYLSDNGAAYQNKGTIALNASVALTFQAAHAYTIVVVDAGLINCTGGDPSDVNCQRGYVQLTGASNGAKQAWYLP